MSEPTRLNDEDRANLVAYLDGELDESQAREVETKLSLDPKARAEAEAMRRTWDLLDYLPTPPPSPNFTHRTLDRIAAQKSSQVGKQGWARLRPWVLGGTWIAAVFLAAIIGFIGAALLRWAIIAVQHAPQ